MEIKPIPDTDFARGQIMAQRSSDNLWGAFNPDAEDGLQEPRLILRLRTVTDETGRIKSFGTSRFASGCGPLVTNAYYEGTFRTEDIVGNLAAALGHPSFGRMIYGSPEGPGPEYYLSCGRLYAAYLPASDRSLPLRHAR